MEWARGATRSEGTRGGTRPLDDKARGLCEGCEAMAASESDETGTGKTSS